MAGGWGERDDSSSQQLSAVSKEQLYNMLAKMRARYHKYKGRYSDLAAAYRKLEDENKKVKEVMQVTQDRALRRMGELREQAALEQQAKAHLEEELRAEIEEKEHIITTLNTKVSILKANELQHTNTDKLIDLSQDSGNPELSLENGEKKVEGDGFPDNLSVKSGDSEKVGHMEDKVKRLESLLSKCKENIKANKNKLGALTEVKDKLASQLETKERELETAEKEKIKLSEELNVFKNREEGEELQMAELKLAMHKEMIEKDEVITNLRNNYNKEKEDKESKETVVAELKQEITEMGHAQETLEKRMEEERKAAMEELSRGKEAALEQERSRLASEHKKEVVRELQRQEEEWQNKVKEVEEEGRLGREDLELQLAAFQKNDKKRNDQLELQLNQQTGQINDLKASKIVLEEQCKKYLKDVDSLKVQLVDAKKSSENSQESFKEKEKELAECIQSMSNMEDLVRDHKNQIETVETQLKHANEEHKRNLENLSHQLKSSESKESSEVNILVESHKTEMAEKMSEVKKLEEKLEASDANRKELQERLDINLESAMKSEKELENKISIYESEIKSFQETLKSKDVEYHENLVLSKADLRDANDKIEKLLADTEKIRKYESDAFESKEALDSCQSKLARVQEELSQMKKLCEDKTSSRLEIEKELVSLREQVNSRQSLQDQMVQYEKELQNHISSLESEKQHLVSENEKIINKNVEHVKEIEDLKRSNQDEIFRLKQDLDMKIRLEREKENSHKEFQKQSIEYEKKLQDQLEEKNQLIDDMKIQHESESQDFNSLKDTLDRRVNLSEKKIEDLTGLLNEKDNEIMNMQEKCETIEGLLYQKEQRVLILEESEKQSQFKISCQESQFKDLIEQQATINSINENRSSELTSLKEKTEKLQAENMKLTKSRERLKQLLDEKEKSNDSRDVLVKSYEDKLSDIAEELDNMKISNDCILNDKNNLLSELENAKSLYDSKCNESQSLSTELNSLRLEKSSLIEEKDSAESEKRELFSQISNLKNLENSLRAEIELLGKDCKEKESLNEKIQKLQANLTEANNFGTLNEIKEENLLLHERLSQYEEELRLKRIESVNSEALDTRLNVDREGLEATIKTLEKSLEESRKWNDDLIEEKVKLVVKELERKIALMNSEHEDELDNLRESQETELGRLNSEHRELISRLNSDLRLQTERLEIMEMEQETALRLGREELEEQMEELQQAHIREKQEMLAKHSKELEGMRNRHESGWRSDGWEDCLPPDGGTDDSTPAIFGVPSQPHPANKDSGSPLSLEEYPEFEYLRNILFEYMMGRQPLILVKVLSAIVKFSPSQVDSIIKAEEKKQSYLASFGLT